MLIRAINLVPLFVLNGIASNNSTILSSQPQLQQPPSDTSLQADSSITSDNPNDDLSQSTTQDQTFSESPIEQSQNQGQPDQNQFAFPAHDTIDSFAATGIIDSVIVTPSDNWNNTGEWRLVVEDGEVTNFVTNMAWFNGISGHTHDFINLTSNDEVELPSDNILTLDGKMDVATNGIVTWGEVNSTINIGDEGRTISILVDHDKTDDHFAGQPVNGLVTSITPCSDTPGPNMVIYPPCS